MEVDHHQEEEHLGEEAEVLDLTVGPDATVRVHVRARWPGVFRVAGGSVGAVAAARPFLEEDPPTVKLTE